MAGSVRIGGSAARLPAPLVFNPYNERMGIPRFFCPLPLSTGVRIDLPGDAARHACRVLRLLEGDALMLFDGSGGEYACCIASVGRDRVLVDVLGWQDAERESPLKISLVQALQTGEKMDFTVQKAVELGVTRIVPVSSRRSVLRLQGERAGRRVSHWQGIVRSACEQCGRNRIPEVGALESLERWLQQSPTDNALRLMLDPRSDALLRDLPRPLPGACIELLIGSEGGLAPEEEKQAEAAGFRAVRLGPRVLRTETAGLAALSVIQSLWGDF